MRRSVAVGVLASIVVGLACVTAARQGVRATADLTWPPGSDFSRDIAGAEAVASGHPLADLHTFAGFDQVRAWEETYLPPEELAKYEDSIGHQPGRGAMLDEAVGQAEHKW